MQCFPCSNWSHFVHALRCVLLVSLLVQVAPARVRADDAQEARVLFDAGVGASGAERWAQARDYFKRSLALAERATTLLNLAVAEVKLGLGHDALSTLDAFDRIADPNTHAAMIERARALRGLAEEAARKEIEAGTVPAASPAPDTSAPSAGEPSAQSSPTTSVDTEESPSAPATTVAPAASAVSEPVDRGAAANQIDLRTPRVLLATGGVLTAVAIGGVIGWKSRSNDLETCRKHVPPCDNDEIVVRERNLAFGIALGSGVVGLGLLTAGALLLRREKRAHGIDVSWSGTTLQVAGRF